MSETLTLQSLHKKAKPYCSKCGSGDVRTEAFVEWNRRLQQWRVVELSEGNSVCNTCGQDCDIKWKLES